MSQSNELLERKEAMRRYSTALKLQQQIQVKVMANPGELLSFDDIAQYLKAVSLERQAEQDIYQMFGQAGYKVG